MKKCIVFLQPNRITCYCKSAAGYLIDQEWTIAADELPSDFSDYLAGNRYAEFTLLLDLPEEECHLQDLKATGFRDRRHIIERLKSRRFENSLLTNSTIARFRQNVTLLLTVIDNNTLCESLIKTLSTAGICLKAIHSATTLTPILAKRVAARKGAQLFIFPFLGCYRLVACMDSSVLFTRRIPLQCESSSFVHDCPLLHKSLEETVNYVQRLHQEWMPSVVLIGSSDAADQLRSLRKSSITTSQLKELRSYLPDLTNTDRTSVETLLMSVVTPGGCGYASPRHRRVYLRHKFRSLCAALALCGVGGVVSSVAFADKINKTHGVVAERYQRSVSELTNDIAYRESHYEHPVEAVRQALVTARLLELRANHHPVEFLSALVPGVQQSGVSVTSVSWEAQEITSETLFGSRLPDETSFETVPMEQIYRSTIAGVIAGTPDVALENFEFFVSVLRDISSDPSVVVVETPFGLGAQHRTTTNDYSAKQGEFVVEISNQSIER